MAKILATKPKWRHKNRKISLPPQMPMRPKQTHRQLVSSKPGHQPTHGGTQQQGPGGRSRSLYLDWPSMRSMSQLFGGRPDGTGTDEGGCCCGADSMVVFFAVFVLLDGLAGLGLC